MLGGSGSAFAQPVSWLAPVDGDWFDAARWSGSAIPDSESEVAVLGFTTPYSVTLDQQNIQLGGIEITNPAAELVITDAGLNRYVGLRGDITNQGTIRLVDSGNNWDTLLMLETSLTLTGSGSIELETASSWNDVRIVIEDGATLTIDASSAIRGRGYVGDGAGTIVNNGSLEGALHIGHGAVVQNHGVIRATDPVHDMLLSGTHIAGSGQYIAEEGAVLDLFNGTYIGVEFADNSPGRIGAFLGNPTLIDVVNRTIIEVSAADYFRSLKISSGLLNEGTLRAVDEGGSRNASISAIDDTVISGVGSIELMVDPGSDADDAQLGSVQGAILTIGSGQYVTGNGLVGSGYGDVINEGHIYGPLRVGGIDGAFINHGLVQAMPGGDDTILTGNHMPGTGVYLAESDARISLWSGSFEGLRFETSGTGTIGVYNRDATLIDTVNNGTFQITNEDGQRYAYVHSGFENNGLLQILDRGSWNAHLQVVSDTYIGGTGRVELSIGDSPADRGDAQIAIESDATLTIGPGQEVTGRGQLGVSSTGRLVNEGLISGGLEVGVAGCFVTNNGVIRASDPTHNLKLGGVHTLGTGMFAADAGCAIDLFESELAGVMLNDVSPGSIGVYSGSATLSTDTTIQGTLKIVASNTFSPYLLIDSDVYNHGRIEVVDNEGLGAASIASGGDGVLLGDGIVELIADPLTIEGAKLYAASDRTFTIGPEQTVTGHGWVGAGNGLVRNEGAIEGALKIGSEYGQILNDGVIRAISGSGMHPLTGTHLPGSGVYLAEDGASLDLGDAEMSGVTLSQEGAGRIGAFSADPTLSAFTNLGLLTVSNEQGEREMRVGGHIMNTGVIQAADLGGGADAVIIVEADTELAGQGQLAFLSTSGLDSAGVARLQVDYPASLVIGKDHSVVGTGIFGGSVGTVVNNGLVDPDGADQTLRLGGNHVAGSGVYTASSGVLDLYESDLNGVRLVGDGTGQVGAIMGDPSLTDVIVEGTLDVTNRNGHRYLNLYSSIVNNGVIRLLDEDSPSNSVLYLRADTSLTGNGRIELLTEQGSHPSDAQIFLLGGAVCAVGPNQTVYGSGQIGNGNGSVIVDGTIDPGGGLRLIEIRSDIALGQESCLIFDLGGGDPGTSDMLRAFDSVMRGGRLSIRLDVGYTPAIGDSWALIEGGEQSGSFETHDFPEAPDGSVYRLVEDPDETRLVLTCLADLTADGALDFFDVSLFLLYFDARDTRADLNNDGLFNFFDVSIFLTSYGEGCG
ncbi:MAG: GC-type dockerin domain-anchored protein [Phycisphaerales bacterium]